MGILVFMLAIMPLGDERTMYLMKAEAPGPLVSKLVPKVKSTAKILYTIYIVLTLVEMILLFAGGMPFFDSVVHALSTAGTGGFSVKNSSIAEYNSAYFEYVITAFMLLFGVNFNLFYLMLMKDFKNVWKNEELRCYIAIVCIATALITIDISRYYSTVEGAFRHAIFQVAAIMSTTGFVTANFDLWPEFSKTLLYCLLILGACGGSTAGGIKVSRFVILLKMIRREISHIVHPRSVNLIKLDGYKVDEDAVVLLDSELDALMVYTVAGSLAAQVNAVKNIHNIGLGLYNDSREEVTITINGLSRLANRLYLYDAHTGKSVKMESDSYSMTIGGDSHGRYYLCDSELDSELDNAISIQSTQRGRVIVSAIRPVKEIKVFSLSGSQVCGFSVNSTQYGFDLSAGIYMIYASDGEREHTEKVIVR